MPVILESSFGIWQREFSISLLSPTDNIANGMEKIEKNNTKLNDSYDLRDAVNASSLESWDDEFPIANVTKAPSRIVRPPRVAESPVSFECKVHSIVRVNGDSLVGHSDIVIGRVVGIHVKGEYIKPDGVSIKKENVTQ